MPAVHAWHCARGRPGGCDCPLRLARRAWGTVTDHRGPPARLDVVPERARDAATAPTIRPSPTTGAMASSTSVISSSVAPTASAWLLLHSRQTSLEGGLGITLTWVCTWDDERSRVETPRVGGLIDAAAGGYRASSSSVRRRWRFPKIATMQAGRSAPGIVISKIQRSGAAAAKTTPLSRTPPEAPT
jgi:hypothetical protein